MIGKHEAQLILACRAAEHGETVITDEQAQAIAALWHSPSRRDRGMSALSHSGKRLASLRSETERELRSAHDAVARLELRSLLAWIAANPVQFTRYEDVVFLQGDDADRILQMIYPAWEPLSASTGWPDGAQDALTYMVEGYGEGGNGEIVDDVSGYGMSEHDDEHYLMTWHFGLGHVALYRKIIEIG